MEFFGLRRQFIQRKIKLFATNDKAEGSYKHLNLFLYIILENKNHLKPS